jgi:hypothetical protein
MAAAKEPPRMPTIPIVTHVFLIVVPLAFGFGALAFYLLRGRHER